MEKNSKYWREQFELLEETLNQDIRKLLQEIDREYRRAQMEMEKEIRAWYQRFATNEGLSMAEARKRPDVRTMEEFRMTLEEYIKYGKENGVDQRWINQLEKASGRKQISRLEALQLQVQNLLEIVCGNQLTMLERAMRKQYQEGYYRTAFELQKGLNSGFPVEEPDRSRLEMRMKKPWAPDGKNFCERIWQNKAKLVSEVHTELSRMCITGGEPEETIGRTAEKLKTAKHNAGRLVMTEAAYFGSVSQRDCFHDLGVEKYEICAVQDTHTSSICQEMDGRVFEMKAYEAGVTAPPFHVFCRSTTAPYFNDEFTIGEMRAARGADGKTYQVPADMKYPEWKKKFVEGQGINKPQLLYPKNYDKLEQEIQQSYGKELSRVPAEHRNIMGRGIDEIEVITDGPSHFEREKKKLHIRRNFEEGELIHELAHVLETEIDLYHDEEFVKVLLHGLDDFDQKIIYDPNTFVEPILRLMDEKFVTEYQGRVYMEVGILDDNGKLNPFALGEYFSEGYKTYVLSPDKLKKSDLRLFHYIERMMKNGT